MLTLAATLPRLHEVHRPGVGGGSHAPPLLLPPRVAVCGVPRHERQLGGDAAPRTEFQVRTLRTYCTVHGRRWYLGLHPDASAAEAVGSAFAEEVKGTPEMEEVEVLGLAAGRQKAARHNMLGKRSLTGWSDSRGGELNIKWKQRCVYLGSFRKESSARVALDAFLSRADADFDGAVAASKTVAAEERTSHPHWEATQQEAFISPCPGV